MTKANTTPGSNRELLSIDLMRALAALGVFYYHQHMGTVLARYTGIQELEATNAFGAIYAVPLFFLISGYCIHLSNLKYIKLGKFLPIKEYLKRRILRIYPAYLVTIIFSIWVNNITNYKPNSSVTDLFVHLFLLQGLSVKSFNTINLVLWTISIELMLYILYPVFYYLRLKLALNRAVLVTLIVSCISIACFCLNGAVSYPQNYFVFNLWFAWCCGAFIAEKNITGKNELKDISYKLIYGIIFLSFFYTTYFKNAWPGIICYQIKILVWIGPLVYVISKESVFNKGNSFVIKVATAIGVSSYSLYLFHNPLIDIKNFLVHQYLPPRYQPAGVMVGAFFIPFIAWFCYKYIEKPFIVKKRFNN